MARKRKAQRGNAKSMVRMSVGFPPEMYRTLEQIAEHQRVSFGWIVRDAAEKYIADRWPLLAPKG